eukprot:TRINITY_DN1871_c0_g1_i4.p1 TRINITY_DN1871_c0_g1~~TRINITY_DN1871_c0_g1_i4.p1  ORF type:complete len:810 (-),score=208.28 TRINITY_DN1871_c0_g1_i4:51-2195(-)
MMSNSIDMLLANAEAVIPETALDASSVLARKAISMLKVMQSKVKELHEEKVDLAESLEVTKQRYDQMLNAKDYYQEKLVESRSTANLHLNIDEKRKPKLVGTAGFWKKLAKKGTEASFRQLVMETTTQLDYLNQATEKYFGKRERNRGNTKMMEELLAAMDDDNFDGRVAEMTTDDVERWVNQIHDGSFKRFAHHFENMTGGDLLSLNEATLSKFGMNPRQSLMLLDSIQNMQLADPEDDDIIEQDELIGAESFFKEVNPFERLTEFHAAEMGLLQQLHGVDPNDLFDANDYIGFVDMYDELNHIVPDKSVLCKIFSLLDDRQSGIISTTKLIDFIKAIQKYAIESRIFTDISPYTNYTQYSEAYSEHAKLTREGARMIIAEIRRCKQSDIRESDVALDYLEDLDEDQLREFLESCPEAAWNTLSRFHIFEKLIRNIESKDGVAKEKKCDFDTFVKSFQEAGIEEITERNLKVALTTVGVDYSVPMNYLLVFNLLGDPLSDAAEIQAVMGARTTVEMPDVRSRIVNPDLWLIARKERQKQLQAEDRAAFLAKNVQALVKANSKKKLTDTLGKVQQDYESVLNTVVEQKNQFTDQKSILKEAMRNLRDGKASMAEALKSEIDRLKKELQSEKKRADFVEAARAEKSMKFHQAEKELSTMKQMYEKDMKVTAEEREARQKEIMEKNKQIEQTELDKLRALKEKETRLAAYNDRRKH